MTPTKSAHTYACHAVINYGASNFLVAPRRFIRIEYIVFHSAGSADGQQPLAVQRPGQVAAVALRAAGHNVRRQRRGRQERRDHQHREYEAQKSFSHVFPPCSFFLLSFVNTPAGAVKATCAAHTNIPGQPAKLLS